MADLRKFFIPGVDKQLLVRIGESHADPARRRFIAVAPVLEH